MPGRSELELRRRIAEGSQDLDDYVDLSDILASAGRFDESLSILEQTLPLTLSTLDRARRAVEIGWRLHDGVPDGLPRAQACAEEAIAALTDESDMPPALALRGAAQSLLAHCVSWTDRPASLPLARQALRTLEAAGRQPPTFESVLAELGAPGTTRYPRQFYRLTYFNLGTSQYETGDYGAAAESYRSCLAHYPDDERDRAAPMLWLGHCHVGLGDDAAARTVFQSVLVLAGVSEEDRQDAERAMAWCDGRLAHRGGRYADAAAAFTRLVEQSVDQDEDRCNPLLWLAGCYEEMGAVAVARDHYRLVLDAPAATDRERAEAGEGLDRLS